LKTLVAIFLLIISFAFDATVPEASGDLRWRLSFIFSVFLIVYGFCHILLVKVKPSPPPIVFYPVIALAVISTLSCFWSICFRYSWIVLSRFLPYIVLFFAVYFLRDKNWYRWILWMMAIGVGFNCLIGIGQYHHVDIGLVKYFKQAAPPAGTLANRNLLASYLVLTLPVVVFLAWSARNWIERIGAGAIIIISGLMLAYTDSRASWLAAGCEIIFFACWLLLRHKKKMVMAGLIVCAVIAGGICFYKMTNHDTENSFKIRAAYSINSLAIVRDHPLGVGIGAWKFAYPRYAYAIVKTPPGGFGADRRPSRAHNDLMQAFVELGILGGLAYLVVFFLLVKTAWKTGGRMVLYLCTGVVGLGINCLMDFPFQLPVSPIIFWTFAGMIAGLNKSAK